MTVAIKIGDCRELLRAMPDESVHCVVTSPPYFGLRDYGVSGQIGLEPSPEAFVEELVAVFREVRRVLRSDGTLWLNLGDTYSSDGGPGWQGKNGQRADRRFAGTRNTVPMREQARTAFVGTKPKDLLGIPWMIAFALRADGWWLRQDIIWHKPNPMPESVYDRCTKAHEYVFLLSKNGRRPLVWQHRETRLWVTEEPAPDWVWVHKSTGETAREPQAGADWRRANLWDGFDYFYDADAIAEPASVNTHPRGPGNKRHKGADAFANGDEHHRKASGLVKYSDRKLAAANSRIKNNSSFDTAMSGVTDKRNKRSVWTVGSEPFSEAHFATFPPALIEPCIKAGCPEGGTVLDPFGGAGTTGLVADRLKRNAMLIELNPEYAAIAARRIQQDGGMFSQVAAE